MASTADAAAAKWAHKLDALAVDLAACEVKYLRLKREEDERSRMIKVVASILDGDGPPTPEAFADALLAAGFGEVAALTAERDALAAQVAAVEPATVAVVRLLLDGYIDPECDLIGLRPSTDKRQNEAVAARYEDGFLYRVCTERGDRAHQRGAVVIWRAARASATPVAGPEVELPAAPALP